VLKTPCLEKKEFFFETFFMPCRKMCLNNFLKRFKSRKKMGKQSRVLEGFVRLASPDKTAFGENVIQEMTDNAGTFATPKIPLATLQATNDDLAAKIGAAIGGGIIKIQERRAAEAIWDDQFRQQAAYVNEVANGDQLIIAQSGFKYSKTDVQPAPPLPKPIYNAEAGKSKGALSLEAQPLTKAKAFLFLGAATNTANVVLNGNQIELQIGAEKIVMVLSTQRKSVMGGLQSASYFGTTCIAVNSAGVSPVANSVDVLVP